MDPADALPQPVELACAVLLDAVDAAAPGLVTGLYLRGSLLWGEFFRGSDVDVTVTLSRRPDGNDLAVLEWAGRRVAEAAPAHPVGGFCCLAEDLRRPPGECPPAPSWQEEGFRPDGDLDIDPVSWAELATRGVTVFGPPAGTLGVHHDAEALREFSLANLGTYWRDQARALASGWYRAGKLEDVAPWCVLGVARLHHLLARGELIGKSGAGRYVLERLEERWHPIAREALRARETPGAPTEYVRTSQRGRDIRDFVAWAVEDALPGDGPHF